MASDPHNARLYTEIAECYMAQNLKYQAVDTLKKYLNKGLRNNQVREMLDRLQHNLRQS